MHSDAASSPAESLAGALMRVEGTLAPMVDHMLRFRAGTGSDGPAVPETLSSLLGDVLVPLAEARPETVADTVRLIDAALDVVAEEIYLVPLDAPPLGRPRTGNRAARRSRRR